MTRKTRRRFTPEYKEQAVVRLSEPGVTYASPSAELGITSGQLKTWHLELLAAGSATAIARTKAEAAELARLRRDVKRLKEENEINKTVYTAIPKSVSSVPLLIKTISAKLKTIGKKIISGQIERNKRLPLYFSHAIFNIPISRFLK